MDTEEYAVKDTSEREQVLSWLQQNECVFLKSKKARKKAAGHTAGDLHCKACDAHLALDEALVHVRTDSHQKRKLKREKAAATDPQTDVQFSTEQLLTFLLEPAAPHYEALQRALSSAYDRLRLTDAEVQSRYELVAHLERLANAEVHSQVGPHLRVQFTIFGSVRAHVASRTSDTNVSISVVESESRKHTNAHANAHATPTFVVARVVRGALERSGMFESVQDAVESGSDCDAPLLLDCVLCAALRRQQAERAGLAPDQAAQTAVSRQAKFVFVYDPFAERAALRSADLLRCYALLGADLNGDAPPINGQNGTQVEDRDDYVTRAVLALVRDWFAQARLDHAESGTLPGPVAYWMAIYFLQRAGHLPVLHAFHDYPPAKRRQPSPSAAPPPISASVTVSTDNREGDGNGNGNGNGTSSPEKRHQEQPATSLIEANDSSPSKSPKTVKNRPPVTILRRTVAPTPNSTNSTNSTAAVEPVADPNGSWRYDENNALRLSEAQCEQLDPHTLAARCARWAEETAGPVGYRISWARVAAMAQISPCTPPVWLGSTSSSSSSSSPPPSAPDAPLARLLVSFFRYYSVEFDFAERVIAARCGLLMRKAKLWHAKRAALEEPFAPRTNLCRSLATHDSFEHVLERLQRAFVYLCVPQLVRRDAHVNGLRPDSQPQVRVVSEPAFSRLRLRRIAPPNVDQVDIHLDKLRFEVLSSYSLDPQAQAQTHSEHAFRLVSFPDDSAADESSTSPSSGPSYYHSRLVESLADRDMHFDLRRSLWPFRKRPDRDTDADAAVTDDGLEFEVQDVPPFCSDCNKAGHLKAACPQNALPPVDLEPARSSRAFLDALSNILWQVEREHTPSEQDEAAREHVASELRRVIGRLAGTAELHTFGSSRNGFAFPRSDLDLCLKLTDINDARHINVRTVLRDVHRALHRDARFDQLNAVLSAKVPIVRFRHVASRLDGDISVYNCLAIENTRMLRLYRDLDPRVKTLGYVLKFLTKMCDISDASKGSLSSYAYTLMLIYFLQQRSPPVLPVLQQLCDVDATPTPTPTPAEQQQQQQLQLQPEAAGSADTPRSRSRSEQRPTRMVDNWDCWFQEDRDVIRRCFKAQNEESVAELWLAFLAFYTTEFAYKRLVVAIRQRARLYKREKCWSGSSECLAIEDPFELSHNLGCGLTYKMNMYILRVFHNELKRCCEAALLSPSCLSQSCLFDVDVISPGEVPMDRCCRKCGHIGHIARECRVGQEEVDFDIVSFPPLLSCLTVSNPLLGAQSNLLGVGPQPPSLLSAPPFALASSMLNAQVVQRFNELASFAPFAMPPRFGPGPAAPPPPTQPPLSAPGRSDGFHPAFFAGPAVNSAGAATNGLTTPAFVSHSAGGAPNGVADARRDVNFGAGLNYTYTGFGGPVPPGAENPFTAAVRQSLHLQQQRASAAAYRGPPGTGPGPAPFGGPYVQAPFNVQQTPFAPFGVPTAPFVGQPTQRPNANSAGAPARAAYAHQQAAAHAHANANMGMDMNMVAMHSRAPPGDSGANSSWSDIVKKHPKRH